MAVGAGCGYFCASVGWVRLGGSGVVGCGSSSSARGSASGGPVGVICGIGGFGELGEFDDRGHGFDAVGRSGCPSVCALVSSGSRFARLLLGGVLCVVRWRCLAG